MLLFKTYPTCRRHYNKLLIISLVSLNETGKISAEFENSVKILEIQSKNQGKLRD